ncbi:hypothetical protein [Vibrio sp. CAU 1672]|uniref:hypothetical protein n=1 Tax=Vibrio sp. CAU 1672 TaxID=3032594 RepID=UPI0023DB334A|nr:hypothetical protein [Vibrio sp. CAU 1672]MDF2155281.1 hypothetical protein [Vibrio sp. CAU 1672]
MDKELLARKLYQERVSALVGDLTIDEQTLEQMWDSKAPPAQAAKALMSTDAFHGPAWLNRYLSRK